MNDTKLTPIFSIAISAYKARFFEECVKSILSQSYADFELIILNDCSPQPINEIVKLFDDTRIRYFENDKNVGAENLTANWNKCLELAKGEYIVIMGDDDIMETNYLQEFSNLISAYPELDVYHCRSKIIDDDGNYKMLTPSWPEFENVYDNIWHRLTERRAQYISDFVYRTDTLRKNKGFFNLPLAWGSDDITAYIACSSKGIAHTNKTVFNYRSNQLSITSTGNIRLKMDANIRYGEWLQSFLKTNIPEDKDGQIVRESLIASLRKLLQKRKIYVMTQSMAGSGFSKLMYWYRLRNVYDLSIKEILFAALNALKQRKAKAYLA